MKAYVVRIISVSRSLSGAPNLSFNDENNSSLPLKLLRTLMYPGLRINSVNFFWRVYFKAFLRLREVLLD